MISMEFLQYLIIFLCAYIGYNIMNKPTGKEMGESSNKASKNNINEKTLEEMDQDPPRNFTQKQLLQFDGTMDEKMQEPKPIYLSVNGTVFDVSEGRDFYGPDGPYGLFAGHECGVALAKMSFDTAHLDNFDGIEELNFGEKDELHNWLQKFEHYRCYPIKGRLVPDSRLPDPDRVLTKEELSKYNGTGGEVPEGYATTPIFVGAMGKVYDVSFGGVTFYGKDCSYNVFAGLDASRALATMSLEPNVAANPFIGDLSEKQLNTLKDWVKTFEERKGYPVVGRIE
jgi:membrane-associated progesterone receptor component